MQKSLLLEALEIVTCHWGGRVFKEDVTISKQTFRVALYSLRRPSGSGQQFDNVFSEGYRRYLALCLTSSVS